MEINSIHGKITAGQETSNDKDEKLKKACADFEAVLIHYMLKSMRKTLNGDALFGKSPGKDMYESMYFQELSTDLAHNGNGIGIKDTMYRQLQQPAASKQTDIS